MAERSKDESNLSLPSSVKFIVAGRNAIAKRVPLGKRLELLKFYSKMFAQVASGVKVLDGKDQPLIPWGDLFARLPGLLEVLGKEYFDIIRCCTDIDPQWAEDNLELEDLWLIIQKVAEANKIEEAFNAAKEEVDPKKKEAPGTPSGSKG